MSAKKKLSEAQQKELIKVLKTRFQENMDRHEGLEWVKVQKRLVADPAKLWSLHEMEQSGGEPDVARYDADADAYIFFDCSAESPDGRRKVCYDREGLESRKAHKPDNTAIDMANEMGIELMTEEQYHQLQQFGPFDTKTSSWLKTPDEVRELGGAIFGDHRFGRVFIYHNGAQSYYGARGFRGVLSV